MKLDKRTEQLKEMVALPLIHCVHKFGLILDAIRQPNLLMLKAMLPALGPSFT